MESKSCKQYRCFDFYEQEKGRHVDSWMFIDCKNYIKYYQGEMKASYQNQPNFHNANHNVTLSFIRTGYTKFEN